MNDRSSDRPDPDSVLRRLQEEDQRKSRGRLKIFFGMCAGVGKTYEMLRAARETRQQGVNVVVGYVETHGRSETEALLQGLPVVPRLRVEYRGIALEDMDLDAILRQRPALVLVDELAHTNAPGLRHAKRYLDVEELLDAGIDVYTTLNVQHLESRADTVAEITGARVRETVPDSLFALADEVKLADLSPGDLLKRLSEGKVYSPERSGQAVQNFFRNGNLTALREMALRLTAERVDEQLQHYLKSRGIRGPWKSGHRLLVAVSASPASVTLIRAARRMAYTLHASWIAVHCDTGRGRNQAQEAQLRSNLDLARELGAEIVSTTGEKIPDSLLRVAREENATQLLIGKTPRARLFGKGLVEELVESSGNLDILVVGELDAPPGPSHGVWRTRGRTSGWKEYAVAAAVIGSIALACYQFKIVLGYQTVSLVFLLAVALLPLTLGVGPVLMAAALSAILWDFLFIPPSFTLDVALPADLLMLITYFVVATSSAVLVSRIKRRERTIRIKEARTSALYDLTRELAAIRSEDAVAKTVIHHVNKIFATPAAIFLSHIDGEFSGTPHAESTYHPDGKETAVASWVYWNERKAGRGTETLPFAGATYYPMSGPRYPLGVLAFPWPDSSPTVEQETLLQTIIDQVSACLEREQLHVIAQQSLVHAESERLYGTLFNSISHELRTPLASIVGSSETLVGDATLDASIRRELLEQIHSSALELHLFVENLLDMSRLESGLLKPRLDWVDVTDLIHTTLGKTRGELAHHQVIVAPSPGLSLVKLDHALMEQVLINILRNAGRYTPPGTAVTISARLGEGTLELIVDDNGPGFPPDALPRLFEKFFRVSNAPAHGSGLGLSIAKGFVEAHGGTIRAENGIVRGARFVIRIPVVVAQPTELEQDKESNADSPRR
jgi:two-component system sensor histidine kinase KdpD